MKLERQENNWKKHTIQEAHYSYVTYNILSLLPYDSSPFLCKVHILLSGEPGIIYIQEFVVGGWSYPLNMFFYYAFQFSNGLLSQWWCTTIYNISNKLPDASILKLYFSCCFCIFKFQLFLFYFYTIVFFLCCFPCRMDKLWNILFHIHINVYIW